MKRRVIVAIAAALLAGVVVALVLVHARRTHHLMIADGGRARSAGLQGRVIDRLGRPIGGARVGARPIRERGVTFGDWSLGASDESGRFTLHPPAGETLELRVEAEGFITEIRRDLVPPLTELEVTLARKLALEGIVRAAGRPAADAEITIAGPGGLRTGKSGPDGAFSFSALAEGRYALRALRGNQSAYLAALDVAGGDGGSGIITVELRPGVKLSGRLRARDGRPIAGGEIALAEDADTLLARTIVTLADGSFALDGVLAGDYVLSARAEGFYPSQPRAIQVQKRALTIDLELDPGATIEGHVVDERAQPVAGAHVEIAGEAPDGTPIAVTALGAPALPSLSEARLEQSGELGILRGPIPFPPAVAPADVTPMSANSKAGSNGNGDNGNTSGNGKTSGNGNTKGTGNVTVAAAPKSFVTDGRGAFRVSGLPAGKLVVVATHPEFARGSSAPLHVAAGASVTVDVVLNRGVVARGRVTDERGQPLTGAELLGDDGTSMALSDGNGYFELTHVAHPLVVSVRLAGYVPAKRAVSPSERGPFDVQLTRAQGRLAGDVVDDRGAPVAGARIEISAAAMAPKTISSDGGGRFFVESLVPGPYRLTVTHPDFAPAHLDDVGGGDGTRVQLSPGGGLDGDVRDARSGQVPAGARVTLTTAGDKPRTLPLNGGHFSASSLPPGTVTLAASAAGYVAWSRELELPAGEHLREVTVRDVRIELELAGQVSGRVRDDRGDGAVDARILVFAGALRLGGRSASDGLFRVDGVPPGRVRVSAEKEGAAAAEDVDVRADDETRVDLTLH